MSIAEQLGNQLAAGRPPARVLLVEDDPNDRELFRLYTREFHLTLLCAFDATAALRVLETVAVELAVIDIRLPGRDGVDLYAQVQERWPRLPVFLITHASIDEYVSRVRAIGPARILRKGEDLLNTAFMAKAFAEHGIVRRKVGSSE